MDASVWALALQRQARLQDPAVEELRSLVDEGRVAMIGAIRQELFERNPHLRVLSETADHLRPFPDEKLEEADYEQAAADLNTCRAQGVQGSNTDFLICAVAERRKMPILTIDADFTRYADILDHLARSSGALTIALEWLRTSRVEGMGNPDTDAVFAGSLSPGLPEAPRPADLRAIR